MTIDREMIVENLKFSRMMLEAMLKDYPEDKATWQSNPGDNHPIWVLGHLAGTDAWMLKMVGEDKTEDGTPLVPESYKSFDFGSTCVDDPDQYPSLAEVTAVFQAVNDRVMHVIENATEDLLLKPLDEASGGFLKHFVQGASMSGFHMGWHGGQISVLRRAMELPPVWAKPEATATDESAS